MPDAWVAECVPCTWVEFHLTQDEALHQASHHVEDFHRQDSPTVRTAQRMGHVQFRTVTAAEQSAVDADPKKQGEPKSVPDEPPALPDGKDAKHADSNPPEVPPEPAVKQE